MEKAESSRKAENEDEGVQKWLEVPVLPPGEDDPKVYEIGESLTPRYKIQRKIGEGTFCKVLECWDHEIQECVAIKVFKRSRKPVLTKYEVGILQRIAQNDEASSRCVQFRGSFKYREHDCIVFEKLGPSLRDFLNTNARSPVPVDLVWKFGRQLLESAAYLHDMEIIHTDLKPENVLLVSSEFVKLSAREFRFLPKSTAIKLIDFGGSMFDHHRSQVQHHNPVCTTRNYRAPEVILGLGWTYPCDLWSIGCILAELCTGQVLFQTYYDELDLEHLATLERVLGQLPEDMTQRACQEAKKHFGTGSRLNWPKGAFTTETIRYVNKHEPLEMLVSRHVKSSKSSLMDLLNGLLRYDPSKRLTARQALEHPFITNPP